MPDHPDPEQLAAFQAGDGDRRQRTAVEAHLAGCPACAAVVASVEHARARLTLLDDPDLPGGLHDRLAAAVETEAARPAAHELRGRPAPWYRRPAAWGAAAAALLAALVAVPLLDRSGGDLTADGGGGADSAQEAAAPAEAGDAGRIPLLRIPGEVSAATIRARLATDGRARTALDAAGGQAAAAPRDSQPQSGLPATPAPGAGEGPSTTGPTPRFGTAALQPCLPAAAAAAGPASRPLNPAFFVEGAYRGRPATILVTTSGGQPGRVDLWVFPRGDCSSPPLASDRVR